MEKERWQWQMCVTVFHGPKYGHRIELTVTTPKWMDPVSHTLGSWRGFGMPEDVYEQARAYLTAVFDEHLLTRYGIQGELPQSWAGEVEPF